MPPELPTAPERQTENGESSGSPASSYEAGRLSSRDHSAPHAGSDQPWTSDSPSADPMTDTNDAAPSVGHTRGRLLVVAGILAILSLGAMSVWYVTGPRAEAEARSKTHAASVALQKAEQARQATCEDLLSPTYKSLSEIDSKLDVGMVERDYTEAVGESRAAYDQIDSAKVEKNSCAAYEDLGAALTQYSKASSYWNDCIVEDYCTPSTTTLNGYWSKSGTSLETVKSKGLGAKTGTAS